MQVPFGELIHYFFSLFFICSPFSALSAYLTLTQDLPLEEKKRTGILAGVAVGVILVLMTWIGAGFLSVLGISLPSFQLAGGAIVFLLALSMLNAETSPMKQSREDRKDAMQKQSIAIVPLAIPLMAGPGGISAVIFTVSSHPGIVNQIYFSICALLVAFIAGLILYTATHLERMIGVTGINIVNRIGGLILAAIAVETMAKGAIGLFPGLLH